MPTFIDELRSNFEIHFRLSKKHSKTQRRSFSHIIQKKTLRRSKFSLFYPISKCGNILVLRFKIYFFCNKKKFTRHSKLFLRLFSILIRLLKVSKNKISMRLCLRLWSEVWLTKITISSSLISYRLVEY